MCVCLPDFNKIEILLYVQLCNSFHFLTSVVGLFPCISLYSSVEVISLPDLGNWESPAQQGVDALPSHTSGLGWVGIREGCCVNLRLCPECAAGGQEPGGVGSLLLRVCSLLSTLSEDRHWKSFLWFPALTPFP